MGREPQPHRKGANSSTAGRIKRQQLVFESQDGNAARRKIKLTTARLIEHGVCAKSRSKPGRCSKDRTIG
jgi:hypothetical protein